MSDRIRHQGLLAQKQLEIRSLVLRANAIISSIHTQCDPFMPLDDVPVDQIVEQAAVLEKIVKNIRRIQPEIRRLERELGIKSDGET